jgi:hypothetical protein
MKHNLISITFNHAMRLVTLLAFFGLTSTASAVTLSEDFENIGGFLTDGAGISDFNVGAAHFTGGVSGIGRIPELYSSGKHAWMVKGGQTGVIQFGADVTEVSFHAKAFSQAEGSSVITAFDDTGNIIETITLNNTDPFQKVAISGAIDRIEFVNNDSDINRMNSLDDFSMTSVPLPPALGLFGTALLAIAGFSKKATSAAK